MNREQINKVIELLKAARKYPQMYMGVVNVDIATAWINGFHACLWIFDVKLTSNICHKVQVDRGWNVTNALRGVAHQMQERGLPDAVIVEELFAIEIETWQCIAQTMDTGEIQL